MSYSAKQFNLNESIDVFKSAKRGEYLGLINMKLGHTYLYYVYEIRWEFETAWSATRLDSLHLELEWSTLDAVSLRPFFLNYDDLFTLCEDNILFHSKKFLTTSEVKEKYPELYV